MRGSVFSFAEAAEVVLRSVGLLAVSLGGCDGTRSGPERSEPPIIHLGAEESVVGGGGNARTGSALAFLEDGSLASGRIGSYSASFDAYDFADDIVGVAGRASFDAGDLVDRLVFNDLWGDPVLLQQPDTNGFGRAVLACGDVTADGTADVAVAESIGAGVGRWAVFVDGDAAREPLLLSEQVVGRAVSCGDQNDDAVVDLCTSRGVAFGPLTEGQAFGLSWTPTMLHVASADLDRDGSTDLVLAESSASTLYGLVDLAHHGAMLDLTVDADRIWSLQADSVSALTLGDMDADGHADLVVAVGGATPRILMVPTGGSGDLDALAVASIERAEVDTLVVADLDGDGSFDLVAAGGGEVVVWRGPIAGSLTVADAAIVYRGMQYPTDGLGAAVAAGDTDGDAVWELALGAPSYNDPRDNLANAQPGRVWWLRAPLGN